MDFRSKNVILFGFILFLSAIGWSAAFQCYVCDSVSDSNCGDSFDTSSSYATSFVSASSACTACTKVKDRGTITRTCSTIIATDGCDSQGGITGCACTSNLCNGGSSSRLKVTTVAFISSLPLIIYKFGL
ncbi:uncharacterized protein LOC123541772 [Mercenaria mercenaria]|uniref:uncharacterized protein LOC123541772 n=1 Tax=Mercenaria mercenaria TaxID=6596 RepID=UPI00234F1BE5|nr:uncharacterized protein LOC123541772 [Mercenaria mercenaria]